MKVTLEPLSDPAYVLRIHPFDDAPNVYVGSASVTILNGVATIRGLVVSAFMLSIRRLIEAELATLGVTAMQWERRTNGIVRHIRIEI